MKKFILGLIGVLFTVALSVVCTLAIDRYVLPTQTDDAHMWDVAKNAIYDAQNPQFATFDDAVAYYERKVDDEITDSFIVSMPWETYEQIVKVLIGRMGECDKKDILTEYLKNYKPVYQYLADPYEQLAPDERKIDDNTKAVKIKPDSISTEDTVINGQLYRILRE